MDLATNNHVNMARLRKMIKQKDGVINEKNATIKELKNDLEKVARGMGAKKIDDPVDESIKIEKPKTKTKRKKKE